MNAQSSTPHRVWCSSEHSDREAFRLQPMDAGTGAARRIVRIDTPGTYTRFRFTRAQATELRDALTAFLDETPGGAR